MGVGFSMKDEAAGEIPVAFVVRSNGSEITEDEIKQYISQQVNEGYVSYIFVVVIEFIGANKHVFVAGGILQENR